MGFHEHCSSFLKKVRPDERHHYAEEALVRIARKECDHVEKPSIIDKCMRRPLKLEGMCLMQFPKKTKWQAGVSCREGGTATETEDMIGNPLKHRDFEKILILPTNSADMSNEEYHSLLSPR